MRSKVLVSALGAVFALAGAISSQAWASDPFYKGKRITMLINFGAGSATDIDGRVLAKHLSKHLEGEPTIIVQNMEGSGGRHGALYLGEIAPKDGTTIGFLSGAAWNYASQPETFRVDFRTYEFAGYSGGTEVYYVRSDVQPGIRQPADLMKVKSLVSGGVAANSGRDLSIRMTLDMLGVPFRHVTGYSSGGRARLALQGNEIQFYADTLPGYRGAVENSLVKEGLVVPVYMNPLWDGQNFSVDSQAKGIPVLPFQEFYRSFNNGRLPSGILWESYLALVTLNGTMQRIVALPPGAPKAAVEALRLALIRLNSDKEFAAEALKTFGYEPEYVADPDVATKVRAALTVKPEIRNFIADYIKKGGSASEKR